MKRINLFEAIEFKKAVKEQFDVEAHWHDNCSGQYFELETTNELITDFVNTYFQEKKLCPIFNEDRKEFKLVEIRQC